MFSFRNFLMQGYRDAIGKRPDYWIILNAAGYANQGVLEQEDLEELAGLIDAKNQPVGEPGMEEI